MNYRSLALISLLSVVNCIWGAGEIRWLSNTFNYGVIKEIEGPATGIIKGVNVGDTPVMINRVRPSCGCTTADYTRDPIAPGDTAFVSVAYNPIGRPGRFHKTVKIYSGEENALTTIDLVGAVIGTPETLHSSYPIVAGPSRLSENKVDLGKVRFGTSRHYFLTIYNQTPQGITPHWINDNKEIDVDLAEKTIAPGDFSTMSIYLNSRAQNELGEKKYKIIFYPDQGQQDPIEINVFADIEPDLSGLTKEQIDNAPRCSVTPRLLEIGNLTDNQPVKFKFKITNEGKSPMRVSKVAGRDESVTIKKIPLTLKPGKYGECEGVILTSRLNTGVIRIPLDIFTDDPLHPITSIEIVGEKR